MYSFLSKMFVFLLLLPTAYALRCYRDDVTNLFENIHGHWSCDDFCVQTGSSYGKWHEAAYDKSCSRFVGEPNCDRLSENSDNCLTSIPYSNIHDYNNEWQAHSSDTRKIVHRSAILSEGSKSYWFNSLKSLCKATQTCQSFLVDFSAGWVQLSTSDECDNIITDNNSDQRYFTGYDWETECKPRQTCQDAFTNHNNLDSNYKNSDHFCGLYHREGTHKTCDSEPENVFSVPSCTLENCCDLTLNNDCTQDSDCGQFEKCYDNVCLRDTLDKACGDCNGIEVCHTATNSYEFDEKENILCRLQHEISQGTNQCRIKNNNLDECKTLLDPTNDEWRIVTTTHAVPRPVFGQYETQTMNRLTIGSFTKEDLVERAKERCLEIGCASFFVEVDSSNAWVAFSSSKWHSTCDTTFYSDISYSGELSSFQILQDTGDVCKLPTTGETCVDSCIPSSTPCIDGICNPCKNGATLSSDFSCDCLEYYTGPLCEIFAGPPCEENEHVQNYQCVACSEGETNEAGDNPVEGNTNCYPAGTCGGVVCSENTLACENFKCKCKEDFSGVSCSKDISSKGKLNLLNEARKKRKSAIPTKEDIIELQNTLKEFAKDDLQKRLNEGAKLKDAIKESRVPLEPEDLQPKMKAIVTQIQKPTLLAVSPPNNEQEDTCDQGFDTPGCGMVDVSENEDELTILMTDPTPGSWSVLTSRGSIVSKQIRVSEFVYDMQCWNVTGWSEPQRLDVELESKLFACNGNVVLIGSQTGLCTDNTCKNNGTCSVDGTSYVCACSSPWTGQHCETLNTAMSCAELDCSDYGGHKSYEGCSDCTAETCCNYPSKNAFNSVCSALSNATDYVMKKCCHRSICV